MQYSKSGTDGCGLIVNGTGSGSMVVVVIRVLYIGSNRGVVVIVDFL